MDTKKPYEVLSERLKKDCVPSNLILENILFILGEYDDQPLRSFANESASYRNFLLAIKLIRSNRRYLDLPESFRRQIENPQNGVTLTNLINSHYGSVLSYIKDSAQSSS